MKFNLKLVKVKPLTLEYYKENLELLNNIIKESHYLARNKEISEEENQDFIDVFLDNQNATYLIALYNEKLIGNIASLPRFEDLLSHITSIGYIVHPDYRLKRVATLLIERLLEEIKKKGFIKILTAEVALDNIASIKLLKKFGFEEYGRIKNGLKVGTNNYIDLLSFSREINNE